MDEKDFGIGAQMIHAVGISNIKLLSKAVTN
jgi:GTP cyclohydrolase II